VNLSATMPPYVSAASGAVYQLSGTVGSNVQLTNSSGDIIGDGVVFFGQGGTTGEAGAPFVSAVSLAGPDYFATGTYVAAVEDYASSAPISYSFDVTGGPLSLSIAPQGNGPISLATAPEGTNGFIEVQDFVTGIGTAPEVTGVFGDQDSVALQNFYIYLSTGGSELGTVTLTMPIQGDRTWFDSVSAQLDPVVYLGTLTLPLTYVRGDNIPQPIASVTAIAYSLNDGDQTTLTATVQNQSAVVSLAAGQVLLDPNSLGGLTVVGDGSQALGTIAPQGSQSYTFTLLGASSGVFAPQVLVTNGQWGWPAGSKESFSAVAQLASNIVVTLPAPLIGDATGVTSGGFTANWSTVCGATGYRLDVAEDSSFSAFVSGYQDLDVGNNTNQAVTGLAAGIQYYYRVRGYDAGGTSGNSATAAVTTLSRIISLAGNLTFGYVTVSGSAQTNLTIYNNGNSPLTVNGISYPAGFSGDWAGTIAAGNSQVVTVTFAPMDGTSYGGSVTVNSDATSGGSTISASGMGATRIISLTGNLAFGYVTTNTSASTNLTIYNNGNTTMTVSGITYPTGFRGNWASGTIPAGNSHVVSVTFTPTSGTSYGGTVTVNSDATTSGANTISASGTGATRLISLSGSLAFGNVGVGTTSNRTVTIYNNGNSPLTVSSIAYPSGSSGNWPSGTIAASGSQNVTVTFSPTAATTYSGTMTVNSDKTSGVNTLSASGTGVTRIISLAGSMAFGSVTVGTYSNKTLTIKNSGTGTMTVSGISYPSGFTGAWSGTIAANSPYNVTVKFSPTSGTTYGGTIMVNSDATSGVNTTNASGTGAARVIALSGNLAFSSAVVGTSLQSTLTIYNNGNTTMTVTNISCPSGFSGSWSGTISAGNSQDVTITFSPPGATNYSGTITVNCDATSGTKTIRVSGTGTETVSVMAYGWITNCFFMQWSNNAAGQAYTVQSRDNLTDGVWLMPSNSQSWPIAQTQWNDLTLSTQVSRFYRVVAVPPANRGNLLSAVLLTNYSATTLSNLLYTEYGVGLTITYGVNWYRLVYETIGPIGARIVASGGLFVPQATGMNWPLLSYSHGTTTQTNAVASTLPPSGGGEYLVGLVTAGSGFVAALADLLGLGSSPGLHPCLHARSEATASVDMLVAAVNFCVSNGIGFNGQIFLAGYSQGGHTCMALQRELETYYGVTVTASAPMSGPYDMSGTELADMLSPRCPPNPYYAAYVLMAYQSVYSLAPAFSNLVVAPYCTTIPPLFNGNTSGGTINAAMPACGMSTILTPDTLLAVTNDPNCGLVEALRDNDLHRWTPVAPMHIYYCGGDQDVLPNNALVTYSNFVWRGATNVQLIEASATADHSGCVLPSVFSAVIWFSQFLQ
jgi:hypothetical protein